MAQNSASHNPSMYLPVYMTFHSAKTILKSRLVGLSVGNLTEPPPPVDDDTKKKVAEAAEKDPTGQSEGGRSTEDAEKTEKTCKQTECLIRQSKG